MKQSSESCKLCKSTNTNPIRQIPSPHFKYEYTLFECSNCSSRFFLNDEHKVDFGEMYEELAVKITPSEIPPFKKNDYWTYHTKLIKKLLNNKVKSALDVGCRYGDFLLHFDAHTIKEGVELSKLSASIAQKRGLKVYNEFLENINWTRKYQVVSAFALIEHLVEPHKFFNQIDKIIEKDGLLIILIPTHECWKEKIFHTLGWKWHMYCPPEHLLFYSKKFLDDYLMKKGFVLVKRFNTSGGMVNPFLKVPLIGKAFGRIMQLIDKSILNRLPIFDHMYSYYQLKTP